MRIKFVLVALVALGSLAMGQTPKSNKEIEAINAMYKAQTPDDRIAAVENLLTKFKDTEFKAIALTQAGQAEQQKGDMIAATTYANRAVEAGPKDYNALLLLASLQVQGTKEFDLDKDEKLGKASKLVNDALPLISAAPKPRPQVPDDQWDAFKKDKSAEAHDLLGMIAALQKKYDVAVTEFKTATDTAATPDLARTIRLASVYTDQGKFDQSIAMLDQVISNPSAPDAYKRTANLEKQRAEKNRSLKK